MTPAMLRRSVALISLSVLLTQCGKKSPDTTAAASGSGHIAAVFRDAAIKYGIPARIMMAVAMKESNLNPRPGTAIYATEQAVMGMSLAESAFGLPLEKIGLPKEESSFNLETQVDAYARWIRNSLEDRHINLNPNPASSEEKFDWIWQIAQLHREGHDSRRNVQIVFTMEMIDKLNHGAIYQDPASGEMVNLTPEGKPIRPEEFRSEVQQTLRLFTDESDVFTAQYFELTYQQPEDNLNRPTHIRVLHCPLSLSACLELQNPTSTNDAIRMGAHYIIPNDQSVVSKPLQVAQHKSSVLITNAQGEPERVSDALVIMLVGDSGRYVSGQREQANPEWFTKYQLQKMGSIIRNVCPLLKKINPDLDEQHCVTPGLADGVNFMQQGNAESYRWGDIPDYDENIFWTYISTPDALNGDVAFEFANSNKIFNAEVPIRFNLRFLRGTAKIVIEQLERCEDKKTIWSTVQSNYVRNATVKSFEVNLFHQGPNENGQQFFRAMAYDDKGQLMGWMIDDVYLTNYDTGPAPHADLKACLRNGT